MYVTAPVNTRWRSITSFPEASFFSLRHNPTRPCLHTELWLGGEWKGRFQKNRAAANLTSELKGSPPPTAPSTTQHHSVDSSTSLDSFELLRLGAASLSPQKSGSR